MGNFCPVHEETIETCAVFSLGDDNFADKTTPFWSPKTDPKMDLAPVLGSVFGPQNGGRFVGKNFAAGRKIAQVPETMFW